jgi:hypothetical protein
MIRLILSVLLLSAETVWAQTTNAHINETVFVWEVVGDSPERFIFNCGGADVASIPDPRARSIDVRAIASAPGPYSCTVRAVIGVKQGAPSPPMEFIVRDERRVIYQPVLRRQR